MTLTINDTTMTSDQNPHTARQAPGRPHQWEVSWLPGQVLDRNTAITAMTLAGTTTASGSKQIREGSSVSGKFRPISSVGNRGTEPNGEPLTCCHNLNGSD